MKRVLSLLFAIFILLSFTITANAENTVSLTIRTDEVKSNRLFDVLIYAKAENGICGGEFNLTYDNSIVEYRSISSDYFEVKAKDNTDSIHIVYACTNNSLQNNNTEIITVSFKSISTGSFDMELTESKCVDRELAECTLTTASLEISVNSTSVTSKSKLSSKSTVKGEKSEVSSATSDTATSDSFIASTTNDTSKAVLYGVCTGLAVVVLFNLGVIFAKKTDKFQQTVTSDNDDDC